jgi:hypothetical protein
MWNPLLWTPRALACTAAAQQSREQIAARTAPNRRSVAQPTFLSRYRSRAPATQSYNAAGNYAAANDAAVGNAMTR